MYDVYAPVLYFQTVEAESVICQFSIVQDVLFVKRFRIDNVAENGVQMVLGLRRVHKLQK